MIDKIELYNFKSHKKSILNFHPGVNIITGITESGKSNIRKAFSWVIDNRPLGSNFRSYWGGVTKVKINTNGFIVSRIKGKKDAYILFNLKTKKKIVFKAFGTKVPEEISEVLNLSAINLQKQFTMPFLLNESAGKVANHFNKIAKLDKIDISESLVKKEINKLKNKIEFDKEELKTAEIKLSKFVYLKKAEAKLEVLELLESDRNSLSKQISEITNLINEIEKLQTEIEKSKNFLTIENKVSLLISKIEEKREVRRQYKDLKIIIQEIEDVTQKIDNLESIPDWQNKIARILEINESYKTERTKYRNLKKLTASIIISREQIEEKTKQILKLNIQLNKLMPNKCPLCGTILTKKHKHATPKRKI